MPLTALAHFVNKGGARSPAGPLPPAPGTSPRCGGDMPWPSLGTSPCCTPARQAPASTRALHRDTRRGSESSHLKKKKKRNN